MIHVEENYLTPRHVIGFLVSIGLTFGQTLVDIKTQTKNIDFSRALSVRPFPTGTGLPSVCNPGEMFFKSDALSGANLYGCVALNSWVLESAGLAGNGIVVMTTGAGAPSGSCVAPSTSNLALYSDTTNQDLWECVATDSWKKILGTTDVGALVVTAACGAAPAIPDTGFMSYYCDDTQKGLSVQDDAGQVTRTVKPTTCSGDTPAVSAVNADGTLTCAAVSGLIASGSTALGTSPISSEACATVVTAIATGTLSTDSITVTPNSSIRAMTGYTPSTSGGLTIAAYPSNDAVNFDVCNWSNGVITPGAVTLNWSVRR